MTQPDPWFLVRPAARSPVGLRLRLICLPFAGGGAAVYWPWGELLPPDVELRAVRLPGRESRLVEPPPDSIASVMDQLVPRIADLAADGTPYVVFGYSMGATLGYELVRQLTDAAVTTPVLLAVGGAEAPHLPRRHPMLHDLDDVSFVAALRGLRGTYSEVLDHPELMALMLPTIRADFRALERYEWRPRSPLSCPIATYTGAADPEALPDRVRPWEDLTVAGTRHHDFPGGHLFWVDDPADVVSALVADLGHGD